MQFFRYPKTFGSFSSSNPANGIPGQPIPSEATMVGGEDPSGDLRPLQVSATNYHLFVDVQASVLPTGAATAANQVLEITALNSIDGKIVTVDTGNVTVVSSVLPTGAATEATLLSIDSALDVALSTRASEATLLTLATEATLASVLGQLDVALSTRASEATLLTLATEATLSSLDGKFSSLGQKLMAASTPVVIASDQSALPISAASLPLPTGAATAALQTSGNASLTSIDGKLNTLGQKNSAGSVPVVISNDQPAVTVFNGESVRVDYGVTPVTTGAWVELVASTAAQIQYLDIYDSSGQTMELGVGGVGSEVRAFYVYPGGNGRIRFTINAGIRVAIRAVSANATVGEFIYNSFTGI